MIANHAQRGGSGDGQEQSHAAPNPAAPAPGEKRPRFPRRCIELDKDL